MKFEAYKNKFTYEAGLLNLSSDYIEKCTNYAELLFKNNAPVVFDQKHFSYLVGYNLKYIYKILSSPINYYIKYEIPKKNGKTRSIHEPYPELKNIQNWIKKHILEKQKTSMYAKAYKKNKSIYDSAKFHIDKKYVLRLDIKDFFPSISLTKVYQLFIDMGYSPSVSLIMADLVTLNDGLPQGASTSPILSNLVFFDLDKVIANYCMPKKIHYTRYADDMIFSFNSFDYRNLIKFIESQLLVHDFVLNKKKTKLMKNSRRQVVNSLVVNKKVNISRHERRKLRSEIYYIKKYGVSSHLEKINSTKINYLDHLIGKIDFMISIRRGDQQLYDYKDFLIKYKKDRFKS